MSSTREERYQRHATLLEEATWSRLSSTTLVVAGLGGLGSHVATQLVRLAPVTLELWDPAKVDDPDLGRQILYEPDDRGQRKAERAAARLRESNPQATVRAHAEPLDPESFFAAYPKWLGEGGAAAAGPPQRGKKGPPPAAVALFDCLDSFAARRGLEQVQSRLWQAGVSCPIFHGGVESWYGQATTLLPTGGGYARAFGEGYDRGPEAAKPIMPHVVATVAAQQVGELIAWVRRPEATPLSNTLLLYDGREMHTRRVQLG